MENETRAAQAGTAMRRLIEQSCRNRPLLLVVEDLHWADGSTLDLLSMMSEGLQDLPALLLVTTRVDGDPLGQRWSPSRPLLTLDLGALSSAEAGALAQSYAGIDPASAEACIRRAAGNPLFLDQLFRHAQTEADGTVPGSVRSLVQARMDRLPKMSRLALQAAAVLGQTFSADDLCHLLGEAEFDPGGARPAKPAATARERLDVHACAHPRCGLRDAVAAAATRAPSSRRDDDFPIRIPPWRRNTS